MPKASKKHPFVHEVERIHKQVHRVKKDIGSLFGKMQRSYAGLDPKTKKKIAAGVASLGIALAAAQVYRKHKGKK